MQLSEAVSWRCSVKNVFLKFSQNWQENTCDRVSFLIKSQVNFIKKRLWHRCFLVNFAKFLRTTFFIEHLRLLLLNFEIWYRYTLEKIENIYKLCDVHSQTFARANVFYCKLILILSYWKPFWLFHVCFQQNKKMADWFKREFYSCWK